jgi:hypothetical protein
MLEGPLFLRRGGRNINACHCKLPAGQNIHSNPRAVRASLQETSSQRTADDNMIMSMGKLQPYQRTKSTLQAPRACHCNKKAQPRALHSWGLQQQGLVPPAAHEGGICWRTAQPTRARQGTFG